MSNLVLKGSLSHLQKAKCFLLWLWKLFKLASGYITMVIDFPHLGGGTVMAIIAFFVFLFSHIPHQATNASIPPVCVNAIANYRIALIRFNADNITKAPEGTVSTVEYKFPKPGTTEPVPKESYVTGIANQTANAAEQSARLIHRLTPRRL
jgi:hypothetical protein